MSTEPETDTRDILKRVRAIEIRTRRLVTEAVTGAYHSSFKGQGMDFEEVREYAPGDDVRFIDWNVTARMDRPFIKKYREERELTILIALDLSASGLFGSAGRTKRELAAEIGSVLAFSATRNNDKVGLILYTDEVEAFIPPKKGRRHILRVIREMLFFRARRSGTDSVAAIEYVNRLPIRHSVLFLISDFLQDRHGHLVADANGESEHPLFNSLALANRRHDVIGIHVVDPGEMELPAVGRIMLEDGETGEVVEVDTSSNNARKTFAASATHRHQRLIRNFRQHGMDGLTIYADRPYINSLRNLFEKRSNRL